MNYSLTFQNLSEKLTDSGPAGLEYQKLVARDNGQQL